MNDLRHLVSQGGKVWRNARAEESSQLDVVHGVDGWAVSRVAPSQPQYYVTRGRSLVTRVRGRLVFTDLLSAPSDSGGARWFELDTDTPRVTMLGPDAVFPHPMCLAPVSDAPLVVTAAGEIHLGVDVVFTGPFPGHFQAHCQAPGTDVVSPKQHHIWNQPLVYGVPAMPLLRVQRWSTDDLTRLRTPLPRDARPPVILALQGIDDAVPHSSQILRVLFTNMFGLYVPPTVTSLNEYIPTPREFSITSRDVVRLLAARHDHVIDPCGHVRWLASAPVPVAPRPSDFSVEYTRFKASGYEIHSVRAPLVYCPAPAHRSRDDAQRASMWIDIALAAAVANAVGVAAHLQLPYVHVRVAAGFQLLDQLMVHVHSALSDCRALGVSVIVGFEDINMARRARLCLPWPPAMMYALDDI